jgi:excisionase family DNA binding protein
MQQRTERPAQDVLTLDEVAAYLRVHTSTIYRLLKRKELPAFKVGSDWRFTRESVDHWMLEAQAAEEKRGK